MPHAASVLATTQAAPVSCSCLLQRPTSVSFCVFKHCLVSTTKHYLSVHATRCICISHHTGCTCLMLMPAPTSNLCVVLCLQALPGQYNQALPERACHTLHLYQPPHRLHLFHAHACSNIQPLCRSVSSSTAWSVQP